MSSIMSIERSILPSFFASNLFLKYIMQALENGFSKNTFIRRKSPLSPQNGILVQWNMQKKI